ncbi:MAG: hypothetical protein A3E87_08060 [Gammaproteobacteria bacterium RIFCSPHIGHO2_12_FULL_35_23]|nr:MAG: hypothetical protein A3E87_08060 [Gammaproteobacteria bacterium RIFCSPHIGHO2_12_FULL_35_23]
MNKNLHNASLNLIKEIIFFRKTKLKIIGAFLLLLIARAAMLGSLYLYILVIDCLNNKLLVLPMYLLILYLLMRLFSEINSLWSNILFSSLSQQTVKAKVIEVFRHLQKLSSSFYTHTKTGEIASSIMKGVRSIEFIYQSIMVYLLPSLLEFVFILIYLFIKFDKSLSIMIVLSLIIYVILSSYGIKKQHFSDFNQIKQI